MLATSLEFPFEYATLGGIGELFYPIVRVELKTIVGWREFEFLVDTGADVTTVPSRLLPVFGFKKSRLRESSTLGVGGFSISTWDFRIPIKIGKEIINKVDFVKDLVDVNGKNEIIRN